MAAHAIDYSALIKELPAGAWVAISERKNEVVAYGAELQSVLEAARNRGEHDPLVVRVPEQSSVMFF